MRIELTEQQQKDQRTFKAFVREYILPNAQLYDQQESIPPDLIKRLAAQGYLGSVVPQKHGGNGTDMITFGLLNEALGRGCSSVRSLLTVHSMVAHAILKRGTNQQKANWLPRLVAGEILGAFALSEPNVGSDAKSVETTAELRGDHYLLNGTKKWITFGQIADLFLVFAQSAGQSAAFLIERNTPGFSFTPIRGMLGTRASMLAELHLSDCAIPKENLIGGIGFGLASIATEALDIGRYTVAWGSVGISQACLEESIQYASERKQFGVYIKDHQLVRQMITDMIVSTKAARLLCHQAGYLKDIGHPDTIMATLMAKYFASTTAVKSASDAVQIHGANGCSSDYPVQRYLRDAKVMEIIEGSSQIQQIMIAKYGYQEYGL